MAVAVQAQTNVRTELRANIPFRFNVADKSMSAGEYTVTQINPASDPPALQLRSKDGNSTAIILMNNVIGRASQTGRLVFSRYGSQYFFAQVWVTGEATGWQAPKSKAERLRRQELAGMKPESETVALSRR